MSDQAVPAPSPVQTVKGVFATETLATVGFGATKRRVKQTLYVYAEENAEGMVSCQPLSNHFTPAGTPRTVSKEDLLAKFVPAPHIYLQKYLPAMARVEQIVDDADRLRDQGQLFTSEFEYKNALRLDENHVRASFGLGLTYLERGDTHNAHIVFRKLSRLEGAFGPEFKHLFNEFGIKLRKNGMHSQALSHYARALRLSPKDEHLYYNLARALYEKDKLKSAKRILDKALKLYPNFPEAVKFLDHLDRLLQQPSRMREPDLIEDSFLESGTSITVKTPEGQP